MCYLADKLTKEKYPVVIFSCQRHLTEFLEGLGMTFEDYLKKNNLTYFDSEDINRDKNLERYLTDTSMGISFSAAWIFKKEAVEKFKGKLLNNHGTRLPLFRGGGGFSWQIMKKNRLGAGLLHLINPGIDTGEIVKYREYLFPETCRISSEYYEFDYQMNSRFIEEFIEEIKEDKDFQLISQQENLSTYYPRLYTKKHGFINWGWDLEEIELFIMAFDDPYPGASTYLNGQRVFLKKCYTDYNDGAFHPFQSGLIYRKYQQTLFVAAKQGTLVVKEILDEQGKDLMPTVKLGDRLFTPQKDLEEALAYRAFYDTSGLKE